MSKTSSRLIFALIGVILFAVGIFAWAHELGGNPGATNLSDHAPWGLYIAFFLFLEVVGAGALFFGALRRSSKLLVIGLVAAIGAAVAIIPDLGSPLLIWRLLLNPNFNAPMLLDVWFLALNVICGVVLLIALKRNEALTKIFQIIQYVLAIALPLGTAWLFTTMAGKPGWGSSLEVGVFLTSAILAGFILVNVVLKDKAALKGVLISAGILLVFFLAEIGAAIYAPVSAESEPMLALIGGAYAWLFWGMIVVLFLLPIGWGIATKKGGLPVAALLGLGVLVSKFLFVVKGNIFPFGRLGERIVVPSMDFDGQAFVTYWPSGYEWLVALGIIGFVVAAYCLLAPLGKDDAAVVAVADAA